jgi:hypothetical protein
VGDSKSNDLTQRSRRKAEKNLRKTKKIDRRNAEAAEKTGTEILRAT